MRQTAPILLSLLALAAVAVVAGPRGATVWADAVSWQGNVLQRHQYDSIENECVRIVTPGEIVEFINEESENLRLEAQLTFSEQQLIQHMLWRVALRGGRPQRRRWTRLRYDGEGNVFETLTSLCLVCESGPAWGKDRLVVMSNGMRDFLAAHPHVGGVDEDHPGGACPLDDPDAVTVDMLRPYARSETTYDHLGLPSFIRYSPKYGSGNQSVKYLRQWNPDCPKESRWEHKGRMWAYWEREQKVDSDGRIDHRHPRMVRFQFPRGPRTTDREVRAKLHPGGFAGEVQPLTFFEVTQQMDYAARPRPTIRSVAVKHRFRNAMERYETRDADECRQLGYRVETADMADGDPAMQGEWVVRVIPPDVPWKKQDDKADAAANDE